MSSDDSEMQGLHSHGVEAHATGARPRISPPDGAQSLPIENAIARQSARLRRAQNLSLTELADRAGMSKAMLSKIENGQTSSSLSTLTRLSDALGVPITALFRGADTPREAVFTPAGKGSIILGQGAGSGFRYEMLGSLWGQHKQMETTLVTHSRRDETFPLFQHPGTELIFMLEGAMVYGHGDNEYTLEKGDTLMLDGEASHGPYELLRIPTQYLAVVSYPSTAD